jgi:hypothetical protein
MHQPLLHFNTSNALKLNICRRQACFPNNFHPLLNRSRGGGGGQRIADFLNGERHVDFFAHNDRRPPKATDLWQNKRIMIRYYHTSRVTF